MAVHHTIRRRIKRRSILFKKYVFRTAKRRNSEKIEVYQFS